MNCVDAGVHRLARIVLEVPAIAGSASTVHADRGGPAYDPILPKDRGTERVARVRYRERELDDIGGCVRPDHVQAGPEPPHPAYGIGVCEPSRKPLFFEVSELFRTVWFPYLHEDRLYLEDSVVGFGLVREQRSQDREEQQRKLGELALKSADTVTR